MLSACPICAEPRVEVLASHRAAADSYTLVHCHGCGLQHWQPLRAPDAAYYEGEQMTMYGAMHAGRRDAREDPRFSRFLEELAGSSGRRLLDVGCSDGVLLEAFASGGNEVVGIDIDRRSLAAARRRGLEVHEATLDHFAAELAHGRRFDIVTMFDVLEHLTEPKRTLELVRGLLAPRGRIFGTVPNRQRLFVNLVRADFPPHHFLRFDRESVYRTLRIAGFVPERVEVFQWGYAGPVLLDTAVKGGKRLLRGKRNGQGNGSGLGPDATVATSAPSLKHRVARALTSSLAQVSGPVERALGRGFKLYFVARRGEDSSV